MNVLSITVITGYGADKVLLKTDLPPTIWPFNENASLNFDVAQGLAVEYCKNNFPNVPVELIEVSRATHKFRDER